MARTARCCCGDLVVTITGNPVPNGIGHRDDCKRRTGGAFGWSAYFPNERVIEITGSPSEYTVPVAIPQQCRFYGNGMADGRSSSYAFS